MDFCLALKTCLNCSDNMAGWQDVDQLLGGHLRVWDTRSKFLLRTMSVGAKSHLTLYPSWMPRMRVWATRPICFKPLDFPSGVMTTVDSFLHNAHAKLEWLLVIVLNDIMAKKCCVQYIIVQFSQGKDYLLLLQAHHAITRLKAVRKTDSQTHRVVLLIEN